MVQIGRVTALYRYPVKGLSPEALPLMLLRAGLGLAHDRVYALALGTTAFDAGKPVPLAKTNFLMLARNESLAQLSTRMDEATGELVIARGGETILVADLSTVEGRDYVGAFFTSFAGEAARGHIRVVSAPGHRFTDIGAPVPAMMNSISLINLASLRALEAAMGRGLDPLRFRANVYVDGVPAWSEFDWIGRDLHMGEVAMRALRRTRRCPATNVDPVTAERDADVPRALMEHFGHMDLGVYLDVTGGGRLRPGDAVVDGGWQDSCIGDVGLMGFDHAPLAADFDFAWVCYGGGGAGAGAGVADWDAGRSGYPRSDLVADLCGHAGDDGDLRQAVRFRCEAGDRSGFGERV